jgi:hypothetical protein
MLTLLCLVVIPFPFTPSSHLPPPDHPVNMYLFRHTVLVDRDTTFKKDSLCLQELTNLRQTVLMQSDMGENACSAKGTEDVHYYTIYFTLWLCLSSVQRIFTQDEKSIHPMMNYQKKTSKIISNVQTYYVCIIK